MRHVTARMHGVFGPECLGDIDAAFSAAMDRFEGIAVASIEVVEPKDLARRIIEEARSGETEPQLLWRAAVARMLVAQRTEA